MKKALNKIDKWLLFFTILYALFGLLMIYSSSSIAAVLRYGVTPTHYFMRQLMFVTVGFLFGMFFILNFPTRKYKYIIHLILLGVLLALIYLLVKGALINSARSWIKVGPISIQPAEFAKSAIIIYMAMFFGIPKKNNNNPYSFLTPLIVTGVFTVLIAAQPDFGGAVILAGIAFLLFLSIPLEKNNKIKILKTLGVGFALAVVVLLYSGSELLNSRQMQRFEFKNPCSRYTENTGYQVCNGLIAINNGGLWGTGLGDSTQKYLYLPEAHTDFIYPIIIEELGAIVGILTLCGYAFILYRILLIAKRSETLRGSIIAYGTFLFIVSHIIINVLGVLGLIPLTGVPLPFLSYGGSFNLNIILMIFLCQRVAIESKIIKNKKEIANM